MISNAVGPLTGFVATGMKSLLCISLHTQSENKWQPHNSVHHGASGCIHSDGWRCSTMQDPVLGGTFEVFSPSATCIVPSVRVCVSQQGERFLVSSSLICLCLTSKGSGAFSNGVLASSYGRHPRSMTVVSLCCFGCLWRLSSSN